MDEREALGLIAGELDAAGDDAALVAWDDGQAVLTTDMLHETTDFPDGVTRYTAGWRAVGASLSDVAAMGAEARATLAVYAAPTFDESELRAFLRGAREVSESVDARYVGGDLDGHDEFTVATTALGKTDAPVRRGGASVGDTICVTGRLGRTAGALRLFEQGETERANELFRFPPRVAAGRAIAPHASAMMDSSDGLARSLHQLCEAGGHGVALDADRVPIHPSVEATSTDDAERLERAITIGEDFELVCAIPPVALESARAACPTRLTEVGRVTPAGDGRTIDGEPLADEGYSH